MFCIVRHSSVMLLISFYAQPPRSQGLNTNGSHAAAIHFRRAGFNVSEARIHLMNILNDTFTADSILVSIKTAWIRVRDDNLLATDSLGYNLNTNY